MLDMMGDSEESATAFVTKDFITLTDGVIDNMREALSAWRAHRSARLLQGRQQTGALLGFGWTPPKAPGEPRGVCWAVTGSCCGRRN